MGVSSGEVAYVCGDCNFDLWIPLVRLSVSTVGLYDDARFPGRLIVALNNHFDHYDEVPRELMSAFTTDLQFVSRNMRAALNSDRVNIAILGNEVAHVHAHLIPRYRSKERLPHKSPWDDPRARKNLPPEVRRSIIEKLLAQLWNPTSD